MDSYAQNLCIQEANRQGCPTDIVLATVESETGGENVTGDNGNALGYGQVWPRFHMNAFNYAAQLLGLSPPPTDLPSLTAYTLANDQFSMATAVKVIHDDWQSAGGNWAQFTYWYVGSGISTIAFQSRQAVWHQYNTRAADYTGQGQQNAQAAQSSGQTSGATAFYGPLQNISLPATNFQVTPGSAAKGNVLYGRKWQVIVSDLAGDKALDVSDLHIQFSLYKTMLVQPNFSTVTIFNLSPETENALIQEGYRCVVSGGYMEGAHFGELMDFNVIQPIRYKQGGTDYVLELVGMDSQIFFAYGTANFAMLRGQNSRQIISRVASTASVPAEIGVLSPNLSTKRLPRGVSVFGQAADILRQIARSEGMSYYTEGGRVNFISPQDLPTGEIIDLTPATGLLGVPQQQQYGVTARVMLNPRITIGCMVHIDNSLVQNQQYSTGQPIYQLDQSGIYRVIQLQHVGDTRGTDWYTQIQTVSQSGILPNMISSGSQNPL